MIRKNEIATKGPKANQIKLYNMQCTLCLSENFMQISEFFV